MERDDRSVNNLSQTFQQLLRYFSHARKNSWCCQMLIAMIIRVYHLGTMNFQTKINQIIVEIFMSGPKWLTDRLKYIGNHRKNACCMDKKKHLGNPTRRGQRYWHWYSKCFPVVSLLDFYSILCAPESFIQSFLFEARHDVNTFLKCKTHRLVVLYYYSGKYQKSIACRRIVSVFDSSWQAAREPVLHPTQSPECCQRMFLQCVESSQFL